MLQISPNIEALLQLDKYQIGEQITNICYKNLACYNTDFLITWNFRIKCLATNLFIKKEVKAQTRT